VVGVRPARWWGGVARGGRARNATGNARPAQPTTGVISPPRLNMPPAVQTITPDPKCRERQARTVEAARAGSVGARGGARVRQLRHGVGCVVSLLWARRQMRVGPRLTIWKIRD